MIKRSLSSSPAVRFVIFGLMGIVLFLLLTVAIFLITRENTLGTDFFIYYAAGRNITVNHASPYADSVGEQSQMAILKHPAARNEDQLRFVYPPYGLIPVLPLTGLPFPWAQASWMAFSLLSIPLSILYAFRKTSPWFLVSLFFLYPLAFGLLLGNLNIPVLCILFLLAGRIPHLNKQQRIESILLGILMAWATIKPQFSAFFILYFLLAAYKKRNTTFLTGFFAGLCGLLVVSFLFIPDWIQQWLGLIRRYPSYTGGRIPITPIIDHFFPAAQTAVYIVFVILFAFIIAWFLHRWWNNRISSMQLLAFGGFVTYFFHPTGVSYEQMIFLFPFCLWVLQGWEQKPWLFGSLWFLTIISSWIFVFLSLSQVWPGATYYGLYMLYILWLPIGLRRLPNSQPSGFII